MRRVRHRPGGRPGAQAGVLAHTWTARRRWAALIQQVWQVDPLECPRCGHRLQIISFIQPTQRSVIEKIRTHGGLSTRAPSSDARAPPAAPPFREFTYISDLEFVGNPGPAEPVWSAD